MADFRIGSTSPGSLEVVCGNWVLASIAVTDYTSASLVDGLTKEQAQRSRTAFSLSQVIGVERKLLKAGP